MYLKQKIPRSSFLSFFDDFRYAGATIVALCSQGLSILKKKCENFEFFFDDWVRSTLNFHPVSI